MWIPYLVWPKGVFGLGVPGVPLSSLGTLFGILVLKPLFSLGQKEGLYDMLERLLPLTVMQFYCHEVIVTSWT